MYSADVSAEFEKAIEHIKPTGYRLLVMLPALEKASKGGIVFTEEMIERERLAASIAYVCKVGPTAYKDPKKFPDGPWCKEGEWVLIKSFTGNRLKYTGVDIELRVINDDAVEAVVANPSLYMRV